MEPSHNFYLINDIKIRRKPSTYFLAIEVYFDINLGENDNTSYLYAYNKQIKMPLINKIEKVGKEGRLEIEYQIILKLQSEGNFYKI